jgi:hypothetical protein
MPNIQRQSRYSADGLRMEVAMKVKPGDIVDGKEIEQDGDVTWEEVNEGKGLSEAVRGAEQKSPAL